MLGIQAQQGLGAKVQNAASELSPALFCDAEGDCWSYAHQVAQLWLWLGFTATIEFWHSGVLDPS